ncbi:Protein of unknown function [Saccharopolyspora kobensis]|uniref:DUF664 domain-containing protein n=1 Tax=Saccharopolyspora kobensis TaxID=146035 RepID=A0A1H5UU12_9PSEU|nr:Protein of unknown function [Saccharopolyspora kobensis]SFC69239.1 Protein of unknown function [Saccharopolyspora kobensis]
MRFGPDPAVCSGTAPGRTDRTIPSVRSSPRPASGRRNDTATASRSTCRSSCPRRSRPSQKTRRFVGPQNGFVAVGPTAGISAAPPATGPSPNRPRSRRRAWCGPSPARRSHRQRPRFSVSPTRNPAVRRGVERRTCRTPVAVDYSPGGEHGERRSTAVTVHHRRWPDGEATDELQLTQEFLQFLRHTAVGKVDGLSPELAVAAPIATSPKTTALGVIKHFTAVERHWISIVGTGAALPSLWEGSPDPSWNLSAADRHRGLRGGVGTLHLRARRSEPGRPGRGRRADYPVDPGARHPGDRPARRPPRPAARARRWRGRRMTRPLWTKRHRS